MLAIIGITNIVAQDWSSSVYKPGTRYPGYLITSKGDTLNGYIKYTDRYQLQNTVEFYLDKDDKKSLTKYKAQDLTEYKMADKTYHVIRYSGGMMKEPLKGNLLVNAGCISEYVWYNKAENFYSLRMSPNETQEEFEARLYPPKQLYHKAGDKYPMTLEDFALGFRKKMADYVKDQAELSKRIADGEKGYGLLNIDAIIAEYNANCEEP